MPPPCSVRRLRGLSRSRLTSNCRIYYSSKRSPANEPPPSCSSINLWQEASPLAPPTGDPSPAEPTTSRSSCASFLRCSFGVELVCLYFCLNKSNTLACMFNIIRCCNSSSYPYMHALLDSCHSYAAGIIQT
jgi:hypothetical protein